jgi:hypothetical protein
MHVKQEKLGRELLLPNRRLLRGAASEIQSQQRHLAVSGKLPNGPGPDCGYGAYKSQIREKLIHGYRAFAWSGDAKKLSSNDNFGKNVAKYSKVGQNERFLLHWVDLGTL